MPALQGRSEGILDPMTAVSPAAKSWAGAVAGQGAASRQPSGERPELHSDDGQLSVRPSDVVAERRRTSEIVARHLARHSEEIHRLQPSSSLVKARGLVDVLYHEEDDSHHPDEVFGRLRWGGLFVYASRDAERVHGL